MAISLWLLGYPDQARQRTEEALSRTKELPQPVNLGYVLYFASCVYWALGLTQLVLDTGEKTISLGRKYELTNTGLDGAVEYGWALAEQGEIEAGIAQMRQGIDGYKAMGHAALQTRRLAMLAETYARAGQIEAGLSVLDEAFAISEQFEQRT